MATNEGLFIDAVIVKGTKRTFLTTINQKTEDLTSETFEPLDLDPYSIRLTVLGSATADAKVLLQKVITQNTDNDTVGRIVDSSNGQFTFTFTAEETVSLGLGKFPIMLELVDPETLENQFTLTEGGYKGEFNKIQIVQV